ncbi:hypothetical protein PFDG_03488 [Plasmodium falciparum Dd2]|uniref:Uncharacterized protein n=1 Tax=Plasmodium falciparum (isolate Dd2) TaxID=57267 RepID=A0A0L7M831_PLAF4|nr:hypothetical protein PFDG_03488 [Plasmodium falciparum Dd2]
MRKDESEMKKKIEKESIALFKKNLLKESYKWFKDTDYFVKLKNENKYSNIENKTETRNIVTGRLQLGWGGTFFLLCCVVVICDNSGWQSCNHYNNNIFYSPESLTIVYSFLYIIYGVPLFIFHQCLGLISQGNYIKSCRLLCPHMSILSLFSLYGTITFCSKEICNFSIELLQNIFRIFDRKEEQKYGMTKIFIDLLNRDIDCTYIPNSLYVESLGQCISYNDEVFVNFYENIWFISNNKNYIYLIIISTLFLIFCYFLLLKENFRVFKFFIFVIIINWITTKSVVIMNTFFFYIPPQNQQIYEEILLIFKQVGYVKLTIFLYGTLARSSSIFILSTFASYFNINTNIFKISIYTFAFYILNMYFYLKNEAYEYFLYNKSLSHNNTDEFNFIKCNTYINMLHEINNPNHNNHFVYLYKYKQKYAVWQKLCLFFSTYSFLFSTIFIVLMQLLGPFNIINELIFTNNKNQQKDTKIYSYKSLVKKYEKYDIHHSLSTIIKSKRKRKSKNDGKYESKSKSNGKNKGEDTNKFIHNYNTREDNYYSTYDKSDEHHDLAQISNHMNSIQSSSYKKDSVSFYSSSHSTNMEIIKYDHGKKQTYDEKNHSNSFSSSTNTDIDNNYNNIYKMEKKNIKNMSDEMMKKKTKKDQKKKNVVENNLIRIKRYGNFFLFFIIYIFTILHIIDFKRNNNIISEIILYSMYRSFLIFIISCQIIYSSWIFGLRLQCSQCGIFSCLLHFITWIILLPGMFLIYMYKNYFIHIMIIGILLNIITIFISYIEVINKLKKNQQKITHRNNNINTQYKKILYEYDKINILKKCIYWLYIGNIDILRKNMNIAISGNEKKYIPFFWVIFFKYINSSMLIVIIIVNPKEYFINMLYIFESSFSFNIELILILIIFIVSFFLLFKNIFTDNYNTQNVIIPPIPMVCQDKKRYIFYE